MYVYRDRVLIVNTMDNIQNIHCQLMKSPRELASWNFPLAQMLEKYFNLLPEPCQVHYGEAAIVIQNSVSAYVRRVEELYTKSRCFSQKMITELTEDTHYQKEQKTKKNLIDFGHFEIIDFGKEIGKNINLKKKEKTSIKFVHHCFSQLENPNENIHIDVYDIQGEVVGRKYDFRSNQQITRNGVLVNELSPCDFEKIKFLNNYYTHKDNIISLNEGEHNAKTFYHEQTQNANTSIKNTDKIYCDTASIQVASCNLTFELNHLSSISNNNDIHRNNIYDVNHYSDDDCCIFNSPHTEMEEQDIPLNLDLSNSKDLCHTTDSSSILNGIKSSSENSCQKLIFGNDVNECDISIDNNHPLKRSKKYMCTTNCAMDGINALKPIPFRDGIPNKLIRNRKEFRLPCHINLLRRTQCKRKKYNCKKRAPQQLKTEESSSNVEETIYSSSKSQRAIDKQDFHTNYINDVNLLYSEVSSILPSLLKCRTPPSLSPINFTPPTSPCAVDLHAIPKKDEDKKDKIHVKSRLELDKLVKIKIKKIYEELDLQNDEDQKVTRWHEEIKPRLMEAERKPPFHIHEYESRIIQRLETCDRKLQFDQIVWEEPPCEVARYFSATLQLASRNNLDINIKEDIKNSIELVLLD